MTKPLLIVVESPLANPDPAEYELNLKYARMCMQDCLRRGEYPLASHTLYAMSGVLDDLKPDERALGIEAGLAWAEQAHLTAIYCDRGISQGMAKGILHAAWNARPIEYRWIKEWTP